MNPLKVAGILLMFFGLFVVVRAILRAVSERKQVKKEKAPSEPSGWSPLGRQVGCPTCRQGSLSRRFAHLKCAKCWFFIPNSWLLCLVVPVPLVGVALFLGKWFSQAEKGVQNEPGSGVLQSLAFWICLGVFAGMCKLVAFATKLEKQFKKK
ncbi:MAG: hypothetical protein Q8R05_02600 [Candidatus Omnitrophota bacterium]|nr:hypothetical protein [Candidatus Omnitrophota bacterium]